MLIFFGMGFLLVFCCIKISDFYTTKTHSTENSLEFSRANKDGACKQPERSKNFNHTPFVF